MQRLSDYRTKLMEQDKAERFAACLRANSRFESVSVCESPRAKSPTTRYFVTFAPSSEQRRRELIGDAQDARTLRAEEQGKGYLFVLDDGQFYFHCINLASGEVYETTEQSCTCPDFEYRCKSHGLHCKHVEMLNRGYAEVRGWDDAHAA